MRFEWGVADTPNMKDDHRGLQALSTLKWP